MLRNMSHTMRLIGIAAGTGAILFAANILFAWSGPPCGSPNDCNVAAPINVGGVDQVKSAALSVDGLAVFGNSLLQAASYLNWGATSGTNGYGIRDNAGALEFKNSGGTGGDNGWQTLQAIVSGLVGGGAGSWTLSGNDLYNNNTGKVGIGTASPTAKLTVVGSGDFASIVPTLNLLGTGDGAQYAALNLSAGTAGTTNTWGIQHLQSGNLSFGYYPSGAPTMQLTQSSNVGIGMTPSNKLDVAGNIGMTGSDFFMGGTYVLRRDGSNAYIFPWGTGYGSNTVFIGGGTNTSLYVTGDAYVASRGLWVSQLASKVGGQFWQANSSNTEVICPSGSIMAGYKSVVIGQTCPEGSACSDNIAPYALCQWI